MSGPAVDGVRMVMDGVRVVMDGVRAVMDGVRAVMDGVRAVMGRPRAGHARPLQGGNFCRGRLWGMRAAMGRPIKAPPGIAALAHRSPSGATRHLPRIGGVCPERGGFLAGKARAKRRPLQGSWPREARPEGLCPFAAAAHFTHSAGASVASGTGVSSGWGAFASRYA